MSAASSGDPVRAAAGTPRRRAWAWLPILIVAALPAAPSSAGEGKGAAECEQVLLEIDDARFTVHDFRLHLKQIDARIDFTRLPPAEQRHWVDDFVSRKLLALRARESGLDRDPEVRARIEFFRDSVLAQEFKDRLGRDVAVTDQEVETYYREHREEFRIPARVLLQHFAYRTAERAARARTMLEEGVAYATLAGEKRTDPDLLFSERGWFTADLLIPPIAEAALRLEKKHVSGVIQTPYGHHVLRLEDNEMGRLRDLASAREEIRDAIRRAKGASMNQELIEELRRTRQVKIHLDGSRP